MPSRHVGTSSHLFLTADVLLLLEEAEGGKVEGSRLGESVRRSGGLLAWLRWDSGWQGGRGSRKRKTKRKQGVGEADRDMTAGSPRERVGEGLVRGEDAEVGRVGGEAGRR